MKKYTIETYSFVNSIFLNNINSDFNYDYRYKIHYFRVAPYMYDRNRCPYFIKAYYKIRGYYFRGATIIIYMSEMNKTYRKCIFHGGPKKSHTLDDRGLSKTVTSNRDVTRESANGCAFDCGAPGPDAAALINGDHIGEQYPRGI